MIDEFNANEMYKQVTTKIEKLGLPIPPKPAGKDTDIQLASDPSEMTSSELGTKLSKAAAWFGHCQYLLGVLESELTLLEAEYNLKLNLASIPVRERLGRQNGAVIEAAVLEENSDLMPAYTRRAELLSIRETFTARLNIYDRFYAALSREQSRREAEMRVL